MTEWMRIGALCLTGLLVGAGCSRESDAPQAESQAPVFKPVDPSQVQNLFNPPGATRFQGEVPCEDCAGIRMDLTLIEDPATKEPQVYELRETRLGSMGNESEKVTTSRGKWIVVPGTPTIYRLEGSGGSGSRSLERVSEQELRLLDRQGGRMAPEGRYTLTRVPDTNVLTFPAPPATTAPGGAAGDSEPAAMVTDLASGWPVTLRIGQAMTARLTADRSAGLRWSIRAGSDGGVIAADGDPSHEAAPSGDGGIDVFRFKAVKSGRTELTFDLRRNGGAEAIRTVSYPVTVQ